MPAPRPRGPGVWGRRWAQGLHVWVWWCGAGGIRGWVSRSVTQQRGGIPLGTIWASLRRHLGPLLVTPEPHLAPFAPNFDPGWPMSASRTPHSGYLSSIRAPAQLKAHGWLRFLPSQFLGRQNPINQAFFCCVIFFGTSKTGFRTPRWVLNRTQLRSEWAPLPPDGC